MKRKPTYFESREKRKMSDKEYSVEKRIEIIKNNLADLCAKIDLIQAGCYRITKGVIALEEEIKKKK